MNKASKKILVIDDDQEIVREVVKKLHSEKYEVDVAYNGKEGFDMMRAMKKNGKLYDLIILEVLVPALNGMEVCEEMHRDAELKNIPVLLVSILPLKSEEFQHSLKTREELEVIKGVLQKLFTDEALIFQVKKLLHHS